MHLNTKFPAVRFKADLGSGS